LLYATRYMLKFWNSLTRTREPFYTIVPGEVRIYSCGPTVYQRAHIGNFRAYVVWDILKRTLKANGYKVIHCMNITDVGHLVSDGDSGEDKMIKTSRLTGKSAWDVAKEFEKIFIDDARRLNIELPEGKLLCRATDHIYEQIKLVQILIDKGYAYKISDGIYFDTSKYPDYGKLSGQALEEKQEGARVEENLEKKNPTDFALWKFSYPYGRSFDPACDDVSLKRQMEWESPWGLGFPGWHVECSAMSRKYLGQPFDIHTGGIDHIPVHHENEIAQSVCAYGLPQANFWLHVNFLTVDGQKMSKSLKNNYDLDECQEHGIEPLDVRYFFLGAHYRSKENFTWQSAEGAHNALTKLREIAREWDTPTEVDADWNAKFMAELEDDMNTPAALGIMWDMIKSDLESDRKAATLLSWDKILGLDLDEYIAKQIDIPENVKAIAERRWQARNRQDWAEADQLRFELEDLGWLMEDRGASYKLKLKK